VKLSVVVCTHDRPDDLRRCVAALAALEDPIETIVVDSASSTPVVPFDGVHLVRLDEPGLSRARNAGLALARGELIAFVDDDAAVDPDWARRIAAPFEDPTVGCVGGACLPDFATERPRWLSERLLQYAGVTRFRDRREVRARRKGSPRSSAGRAPRSSPARRWSRSTGSAHAATASCSTPPQSSITSSHRSAAVAGTSGGGCGGRA
jgi:glycosyltransferase involved in cell wall biosynthesis